MLRAVRLTLLVAVVLALAVPAGAEARQLVRYDVGGGLAGRFDHLVVSTGGTATQTGSGGDHRSKLSPRSLHALKRDLRRARFSSLRRSYEPDRQVFDGISQSVRHRGKTVSVSSGADYPQRLHRLLARLQRLMRD